MSNIEKDAFEFVPDLSLLKDINWDCFDSSLLLIIWNIGLDQYNIINKYSLPNKQFLEK